MSAKATGGISRFADFTTMKFAAQTITTRRTPASAIVRSRRVEAGRP
jgi:hypothetical protein